MHLVDPGVQVKLEPKARTREYAKSGCDGGEPLDAAVGEEDGWPSAAGLGEHALEQVGKRPIVRQLFNPQVGSL